MLALRESASWQFNPGTDVPVRGGTTLVVMTTPGGRESLVARFSRDAAPALAA